MSARQPHTDHALRWLAKPDWPGQQPESGLKLWLTGGGWLTARLKQLSPAGFRVQVLPEAPGLTDSLGENPVGTALRRVVIWCDNKACIYAETAIPPATSSAHPWLDTLGAEPLGQALENRPDVSRSGFEYALVTAESLPANIAATTNESYWARRSIFSIGPETITVTEVFLPGINSLDLKPLHPGD